MSGILDSVQKIEKKAESGPGGSMGDWALGKKVKERYTSKRGKGDYSETDKGFLDNLNTDAVTMPEIKPPPTMPIVDDAARKRSAQRNSARRQRSGRASTILTDSAETLG